MACKWGYFRCKVYSNVQLEEIGRATASAELHPQVEAAPLQWYTFRAKGGTELRTVNYIQRRGFNAYTPTWTEKRKWSGRPVQDVERLFFGSYLFVQCNTWDFGKILPVPGVMDFIQFSGHAPAVTDSEMEQLRNLSRLPGATSHGPLHTGRPVRIRLGQWAGIEGKFVSMNGLWYVGVEIQCLGRSIVVRVERDMVEPI